MADFLSREKQTASASLKAQYGTETGKTQLNSVLKTLLNPEKSFTKDTKDWCKWLIAGGESPDVFLSKLRAFDSSQTCGLVWHKNFVAYRCRDCGTSPCMSICADCFHGGDHRGHDYNMFRSQAGGACDCGDENVMKKEGFCSSHGKNRSSSLSHPPTDALYMAKAVIPHLFNRLYREVELARHNSEDSILSGNEDIDEIVDFLQELCGGEVLRSIICDVIVEECLDVSESGEELRRVDSETSCSSSHFLSSVLSYQSTDYCEHESASFLDLLLDIVIKLDFPEKLVTFLLQLLPDQTYKVAFTQKFCEKYQEIGKLLTLCSTLQEVEQLSNSVVHISVQLFSNKTLVTKMVEKQNLLHVMVKVLLEMMRTTLQPMRVNGQCVNHLVINCDKAAIQYHCYWPVVSDLINVVTHNKIAYIFMKDSDLLEKWMNFLACLTGMNCNERVMMEHIKYEPTTYNAAYFIEIEAASSPMWSLIAASSILNDETCVLNVIKQTSVALARWQNKVAFQPSRAEVTFHLPLLRYFSAFVKQAMLQFSMKFEDLQFDLGLLTKLLEWPTCIQAAVCEIRAGLWARNGHQIQAQSAWYHQCHFSTSMLDLDIFFLQICAAQLDPEYFLGALVERFRVEDWFQFPIEVPESPGVDDDNKEMMVEGLLSLILTVLNCRLHCGMSLEETLRLEMVTLLCFSDRTHSQLVDLVPERYGQTMNTQLFEKILNEISDYKHPGCDSSGMQQGMYTLRSEFWETHFDPAHALLRAFNRREFQSAMVRYTNHLRHRDSCYVTSSWPPFRPLLPTPRSFDGLFRLLHCKKLHRMLYLILYKATSNVIPISETIIYLTVHLTTLAVQSSPSCFEMLPCPYQPSLSDVSDTSSVIVTKCLHFLNQHGTSVKSLHRNEDFSEINETLLSDLMYDPDMGLDVKTRTVKEISLILGHILHYRMEPPLFTTILPYMNTVLSNALNNSCSQSEREAQLQHIQFLLETLPAYRYNLAKCLIAYLVKYIERERISMKDLSIIGDETQPLELTMLFTYLIKYHEKLFRVYPGSPGLPRDISSLEFPSNHLVDNIRHEPRILPESPSMLNFYNQGDVQGSSSSTFLSSDPSTKSLVEEFIEFTHASKETAMCLLEKYEQNLEVAVNIYLESSSTDSSTVSSSVPMDIDGAQIPLVKMSSQCCDMESEILATSDLPKSTGDCPSNPGYFNNSFLSLLVKLKTVLLMSVSSPVSPRCTGVAVVNDGVRKIEKLLELICRLSSSNVEAVGKLDASRRSLSPTNDIEDPLAKQELKRKMARERQQRVLAEFAKKQEKFLRSNCQGAGSEVDGKLTCTRSTVELFDCAICGQQSVPSTEQEPVGYVAFLQAGTVLKHRRRSDTSKPSYVANEGMSSSESPTESFCCGSVCSARRKFLLTYFEKIKATQACELGIDGGVHIQSCGHCLHLKCHQSYLQSLKEERTSPSHRRQSHSFDVTKEEFICPVCRRLGNAILPILPSDVMPASMCSRTKGMCHRENMRELESTIVKSCSNNCSRLTTSALQQSVLSTSVVLLVETINRLNLNKECGNMTISQHKFSLIVETARSNLEAEHIAMQAGKLSPTRIPFYGTLLRTLQFQCQTLVRPLCHVLALLTGRPVETYGTKSDEEIPRNDVPLLLRDCVCLLLQLVLSWPAPLNLKSFQCLVQVVFNVVLVQALVKTCCALTEDERTSWQIVAKKCKRTCDARLSTDVLLGNVCLQLADSTLCQATEECPGISQSVWSPHSVEATIQKRCLPFLRLVSSLSSLCYSAQCSAAQDDENEFYLLTQSLGLHNELPQTFSISNCFKWSHEPPLTLIKTWCKQLRHVSRRHDSFPKDLFPGMDEWEIPRLLELPERYDCLFQTYRKKSCETCDTTPDEPTLCLVCGTFLCLRGKCCERQETRECVRHAMECGYGTAVFLILMSSSVFVIRGEKASVWGSVYLDEFGEEDIDLRRGKPLFLCRERYKKLQEQWITHNFDSICKTWMPHHNNL